MRHAACGRTQVSIVLNLWGPLVAPAPHPSPTSPRVSCQHSVLATEQRFDMTRCGRTFKFYDPLKIGRNITFYNLPLKRQRK